MKKPRKDCGAGAGAGRGGEWRAGAAVAGRRRARRAPLAFQLPKATADGRAPAICAAAVGPRGLTVNLPRSLSSIILPGVGGECFLGGGRSGRWGCGGREASSRRCGVLRRWGNSSDRDRLESTQRHRGGGVKAGSGGKQTRAALPLQKQKQTSSAAAAHAYAPISKPRAPPALLPPASPRARRATPSKRGTRPAPLSASRGSRRRAVTPSHHQQQQWRAGAGNRRPDVRVRDHLPRFARARW
jgi:hypothetical protein